MSLRFHCTLRRSGFELQATAELPADGITAIWGPSGCGKSSLLRCLAGLEPTMSGSVHFNETVWSDAQTHLPTPARRVGLVFQRGALFDHLTVRDNILYGWRRAAEDQRPASIDAAVEECGVGALLDRRPGSLSGGERQRVALARALVAAPAVLLLDEPLAALDTAAKEPLMTLLASLRQRHDLPVLLVSHAIDELARLADRVLVMQAGHTTGLLPIPQFLTEPGSAEAQHRQAQAVVDAEVINYHAEETLLHLRCGAGELRLITTQPPAGDVVRVCIQARDVSLSKLPIDDSTILNSVECRIEQVEPVGNGQLIVHLRSAAVPLLARVTSYSMQRLGFTVGDTVYAQFKSAALS